MWWGAKRRGQLRTRVLILGQALSPAHVPSLELLTIRVVVDVLPLLLLNLLNPQVPGKEKQRGLEGSF